MTQMIMGLFADRAAADSAIDQIRDAGYDTKDISIVVREEGVNTVISGAVSGATTGGVIGGIAGLLIGVGAIAIPGIGAVLIGGPLAAALGLAGAAATTVSGAVTGAAAGGLLGALAGLGVPEPQAKIYEERIREGAVLVAVPVIEDDTEVEDILKFSGATDITKIKTKS